MKKIGKILRSSIAILCYSIAIFYLFSGILQKDVSAQVRFTAKSPSVVGVNEGFTITFSINAKNPKHFVAPSVSGAKIVAGPSQSSQSSTSIINGHISSYYSISYSYTLVASNAGTVNISPAKISIDGKVYSSNSLKIKVSNNPPQSQRQQAYDPFAMLNQQFQRSQQQRQQRYQQQRQSQNQNQSNQLSNGTVAIDNKAIFVRAIPSKTDLVKGEEVIVTYKLYTLMPVRSFDIERIPSSTGFWTENIEHRGNVTLRTEHVNGQTYQVADMMKVILYPQKSGLITIKPMKVTVEALLARRTRQTFSTGDPFFDQFLNDPMFSSFGTSYQIVNKTLYTNSLIFNVKDLPPKPDNFSGAVGNTFSMTGNISTQKVKAFDAFYLTYTLSGRGNLTLIGNLPLNLPDEFQLFDPEITDNITRSESGLSGTRTFRYLVIPRVEGKFTIPDLNIVYYNTIKGRYETISTKGYSMMILKGDANSSYAKQIDERMKYRSMDIVDKNVRVQGGREMHIFDRSFIFILPIIFIVILALAIILYARNRKLSLDVENMKLKRAMRVARKRLKKAKKFLKKERMEDFEDEVSIALWDYLLDRFKINKSDFSIENCKDKLIDIGVEKSTCDKLVTVFNRCMYLRYSQDKEAFADNTLYEDALQVIVSIEQNMKTIKKLDKNKVKDNSECKINIPTAIVIALLFLSSNLIAAIPQKSISLEEKNILAEKLYKAKDYDSSLSVCLDIIRVKPSAGVYSLTANNYFRLSDYAMAMLYYEKAHKLSPNDKTINLNIKITSSRLVGSTYIMPEFVLIRWAKYVSGLMSISLWATAFISLFIVFCISLFIYLFTSNKKVFWFYVFLFAFILSLTCMGFGILRQNIQNNDSYAIIMKSNIHVKETQNTSGKDAMILYKGQKIKILEEDEQHWKLIETQDHKKGYMQSRDFKRI